MEMVSAKVKDKIKEQKHSWREIHFMETPKPFLAIEPDGCNLASFTREVGDLIKTCRVFHNRTTVRPRGTYQCICTRSKRS